MTGMQKCGAKTCKCRDDTDPLLGWASTPGCSVGSDTFRLGRGRHSGRRFSPKANRWLSAVSRWPRLQTEAVLSPAADCKIALIQLGVTRDDCRYVTDVTISCCMALTSTACHQLSGQPASIQGVKVVPPESRSLHGGHQASPEELLPNAIYRHPCRQRVALALLTSVRAGRSAGWPSGREGSKQARPP
jgi:hypothetical protein